MILKKLKTHLEILAIIILPLGMIFYLVTKSLFLSIGTCLILSIIVAIDSVITDNLGYKRHYQIIESDAFKKLLSKGFEVENVNKYKGIKGIYRNFLFDIYYDWQTIPINKNYRAIVLNVYFESPLLGNNEIDQNRLLQISEKNKNSYWCSKSKFNGYRWRNGNVLINNPIGIKNPSYEFIIQKMDLIIDLLHNERLQPTTKKTITELRKTHEFANAPEILLYFEKNSH